MTAAGHQTHNLLRTGRIQTQYLLRLLPCLSLMLIRINPISHGMTHAVHRYSMLLVDIGLKRKQGEHQINSFGYFENALLAPGPHAGADVVNSFDAKIMQRLSKAQIKSRRIDTDKDRWLFTGKAFYQVSLEPE
jgi:hypothetical protein